MGRPFATDVNYSSLRYIQDYTDCYWRLPRNGGWVDENYGTLPIWMLNPDCVVGRSQLWWTPRFILVCLCLVLSFLGVLGAICDEVSETRRAPSD